MTTFTVGQAEAAVKLREAHERLVMAEQDLEASVGSECAAAAALLVARSLYQEAIREAEAAFQPLMP